MDFLCYSLRMNNFKIKDWVCVSRLPSFNLFQNQITAELAEEYVLEIHSEEILQAFQILASSNLPQVTKLLHFQKFTKYDPVYYSFNSFNIRLFSEFLQSRLREIGHIPDNYLLQIVYESLIAFETVFRNLRPIKATPNNIGFNKKNQLRIVIYEDLINQPNFQLRQQEIVKSVLDVYHSFIPQNILIPSSMNFTQAIYFIGYRVSGSINQISTPKLTRKQPRFSVFQPRIQTARQSLESFNQQVRMRQNSQNRTASQNYLYFSPQFFSNQTIQQNNHNIPSTFRVNIQEARTTQNNLPVINDVIELDKNQLPLELLDSKKPSYIKLNIIDKIISDDNLDEDLKKMCKIYKHAILYDPALYQQLKRVKGKTQEIQNPLIRRKIQDIIQNKNKYQGLTTRIPSLTFSNHTQPSNSKTQRNQRIKKIVQNQKNKIHQNQTSRSHLRSPFNSLKTSPSKFKQTYPQSQHTEKIKKLNVFKEQAEKIIFDF